MTLDGVFEHEANLLRWAPQKYGAYFSHGCDFTSYLSLFIKSVSGDREIFMRYMSQAKKHHTLALMSAARLHHVQAQLNLRIVLESAANAAYALANPAFENFLVGGVGTPAKETQHILGQSYKWMASTLPDHSEALKAVKDRINGTGAHSNIVYSQSTFRYAPEEEGVIETPFFDIEDAYFVKTNLWSVANTALGVIGLTAAASEISGGLVLADDFMTRFPELMRENERLKAEFVAGDRYRAAMILTEQAAAEKAARAGAKP